MGRASGSSDVRRRSKATRAESTAGGGLKQLGGTFRMYRGLRGGRVGAPGADAHSGLNTLANGMMQPPLGKRPGSEACCLSQQCRKAH